MNKIIFILALFGSLFWLAQGIFLILEKERPLDVSRISDLALISGIVAPSMFVLKNVLVLCA